jgi:hypothetical protein
VTVDFATADGTAASGLDYMALTPGTLTFAPGEMSKTVTVEVIGDTAVEPTETFSMLLSEATNATIEQSSALGTILDDDVTLVGKGKATFTDVDGDLVTIAVSKGTLKVEDFTVVPSGLGSQLALVVLSGEPEFAGANLSITAKRPAGITGAAALVHVGYINATGVDLGKMLVQGDVGRIDAGDDLTPERGVVSLTAQSLGRFGLSTQLPGGSSQSDIIGALKSLKLADGMRDATLSVSGDIGTVAIKGDVLGSAIRSDGNIRALKISGDLAASALSAAIITARGTLVPTSVAQARPMLPCEVRASKAASATGICFSASRNFSIWSAPIGAKPITWQRERIVGSSAVEFVVVRIRWLVAGGSSRTFSNAFDEDSFM